MTAGHPRDRLGRPAASPQPQSHDIHDQMHNSILCIYGTLIASHLPLRSSKKITS